MNYTNLVMKKPTKTANLKYSVTKIKKLVKEMIEEDQKMRQDEIEWSEEIDKKHTESLKPILKDLPDEWPKLSEFGDQTCTEIWMLVQHADHDIEFQKDCLSKMNALLEKQPTEVNKQSVSYLTDRIMVKEAKQQKYGTQFQDYDTFLVLRPLVEPENIDQLRAEMDLDSIEGYRKTIEEYAEVPVFLNIADANNAGFKVPKD